MLCQMHCRDFKRRTKRKINKQTNSRRSNKIACLTRAYNNTVSLILPNISLYVTYLDKMRRIATFAIVILYRKQLVAACER